MPTPIIGQIEANIPFQFHAGSAKFPASKYILRVEQGSDLGTMEIQSYDGHSSALFEIRDAQAPTSPTKRNSFLTTLGTVISCQRYSTRETKPEVPWSLQATQRSTARD